MSSCPERPDTGIDPVEDGMSLADTPKKVVGDEGSVEERSLTERIALDKYANERTCAAGRPPFGMYMSSVRPRGTV